MTSRSISHSEISTAMLCQARHALAYTGHLTGGKTLHRRQLAPRLSAGRAWGAAVAAWHAFSRDETLFWQSDAGRAAMAAHAALRASLIGDVMEQRESGFLVPIEDQIERENFVGQILDHHMASTKPLPNLTRLEHELDVPIPSRTGRGSSSRYRFQGFLDGFTVDENGNPWIVEFKLRDSLTPLNLIVLNRQIRYYAWGMMREMGETPVGCIMEERLAQVPKPPRLVQAGKEDPILHVCPRCEQEAGSPCLGVRGDPMASYHPERRKLAKQLYGPSHATDQLCLPQDYIALCETYGEEPHPEVVETMRAREWSRRHIVIFRKDELAEAGRELVSAAKLIRDLDAHALHPVRNSQPYLCRGCRYVEICATPEDTLLVDTLFSRETPKRLRGIEEVEVAPAQTNGSAPLNPFKAVPLETPLV